jgi:hypothetical protein
MNEPTDNYFTILSAFALVSSSGPIYLKAFRAKLLFIIFFTKSDYIFFNCTTGAIETKTYNLSLKKSVFSERAANIYAVP